MSVFDLQLRLIAPRRNGNHALQNWLSGLTNFSTVIVNNCAGSYASLPNRYIRGTGRQKNIAKEMEEGEHWKKVSSRFHSIIYGLENFDLIGAAKYFAKLDRYQAQIASVLEKSRFSSEIKTIVALRDPFNALASQYRSLLNKSMKRNKRFDERRFLERKQYWLVVAREVERETTYLDNHIYICYDRWFSSERYRIDIAGLLGLPFSDRGLQFVTSTGSSFDKHRFAHNAQQMGVLRRWEEFAHDQFFKETVLQDTELQKMRERLFKE